MIWAVLQITLIFMMASAGIALLAWSGVIFMTVYHSLKQANIAEKIMRDVIEPTSKLAAELSREKSKLEVQKLLLDVEQELTQK